MPEYFAAITIFVQFQLYVDWKKTNNWNKVVLKVKCLWKRKSLSLPMGVDYVVIGFDMEVQPLVTHNAA